MLLSLGRTLSFYQLVATTRKLQGGSRPFSRIAAERPRVSFPRQQYQRAPTFPL
jgi:hypothetical protein